DNLSIYAARRSSDSAITLMVVNKAFETQSANLALAGLNGQAAEFYQYSAANLNQIVRLEDATVANDQLTISLPSQSFMLVVVDADASSGADDNIAYSETTLNGVAVAGNFGSTWATDGDAQRIQEDTGGTMEHQWVFNVTAGGSIFYVNAEVENSAENETFNFEYSTDNTEFIPMVTITSDSTRALTQSYLLPEDVSGRVYVRVIDADRATDSVRNTISVDYIGFQSSSVPTSVTLSEQSVSVTMQHIWTTLSALVVATLALAHSEKSAPQAVRAQK
ncbi:MAG: hypothetical protein ACPG8W_22765, partial [Candidatus Promineifilaceae bacterium]